MIKDKIRSMELTILVMMFVIIMMVGAISNLLVLATNDGKMPVKNWDSGLDNLHSSFKDKSDINYYHFADIIGWKDTWMFSYGDILIVIGISGTVITFFFYFKNIKWKKKSKKVDDAILQNELKLHEDQER